MKKMKNWWVAEIAISYPCGPYGSAKFSETKCFFGEAKEFSSFALNEAMKGIYWTWNSEYYSYYPNKFSITPLEKIKEECLNEGFHIFKKIIFEGKECDPFETLGIIFFGCKNTHINIKTWALGANGEEFRSYSKFSSRLILETLKLHPNTQKRD